jgi:GNAT superfamily N-acetyltransferase
LSPVVDVVRTYLELRSPEQLRAARADAAAFTVVPCAGISAQEYRALYAAVGAAWHWIDRNAWTDEVLASYLARADVAVWECRIDDESAGYFELARHDDGSVEIVYFGLAPNFIGRGLGKALLTRAVEEAWRFGANKVWLHTCTLDSPNALPNYLARGFSRVREEVYQTSIVRE